MDDSRAQIAVVGFFDTKLAEHAYLQEMLQNAGCSVIMIDTSITPAPNLDTAVEHPPAAVCDAAGTSISYVRTLPRTEVLEIMVRGATRILAGYERKGQLHGVVGLGGSTSTALVCEVMQTIKLGMPKVCISTMASGDVRPYIKESDIILMPTIVDMSGTLNSISMRILKNAAAALCGMANLYYDESHQQSSHYKTYRQKKIAVTMFGLTTPGVTAAVAKLKSFVDPHSRQKLYEPIVFHATGSGGRGMERLISEGEFDGVLDITTTELADDLCGGVLSAGPERLTAAGKKRIPQVVSLGALDMVNFGERNSIPSRYTTSEEGKSPRLFHEHNSAVTLMRTTKEECGQLGESIARKLKEARGPTVVVIPRGGWSGLDVRDGKFWDEEANGALADALKQGLEGSRVEIVEVDGNVNEEGAGMADILDRLMK